METQFISRWRKERRGGANLPERWKNLTQVLAPVSDDGMDYGTLSSGSVLPGYDPLAKIYYVDPVIKPITTVVSTVKTPVTTELDNPPAQVQFIDIDEYTALSNEGIIIPANANVVIVPVSEVNNPDLFQEIVQQQILQPQKPIYDIVTETVAPLSYTNTKDDTLKQEILFNQAVVDTKQEFPKLTINEAAVIVNNTKPIPVNTTNPIVTSIKNEIVKENTKPATKPLTVVANIVDNLINKTTTGLKSGFIADDVKESMANDTNGLYLAGSVVVIGVLALLFKN